MLILHILNLETNEVINGTKSFSRKFYKKNNSYLMLTTPKNLRLFKKPLDIDEVTFEECLEFDEVIKLDLFDDYDFLSLNTFELLGEKYEVKEVNIYLSENFILVVVDEDHFLYKFIKNIITKKLHMEENPTVSLFKINYLIFNEIIVHEFESLEKVEDMILEIEDDILDEKSDIQITRINDIRSMTRKIVKNTRPLLYIGDRIVKGNIRYLKYSDVKKFNLENVQGIDFGIDKLYNFAISTRELADKLLDIYSSRMAEETNSLITKLTVLTGISAPLTIITGIYGMNFKYMPELNWVYGYPLILLGMAGIVIVGIIIFKIKKIL